MSFQTGIFSGNRLHLWAWLLGHTPMPSSSLLSSLSSYENLCIVRLLQRCINALQSHLSFLSVDGRCLCLFPGSSLCSYTQWVKKCATLYISSWRLKGVVENTTWIFVANFM